ncbi:MAG: hypothetical protein QOG71_3914 [Pyrinomonadaceae bacterium]|nr:hypothetical protein [Pyrinomonadaceae bacterium]
MSALKDLEDEELLTDVGDHEEPDSGEEIAPLPPRQERALEAVLSAPTLKEAARAAGIGETTLWRYMREPAFKRRLREAQQHHFTQTAIRVQRNADDAITVLHEIMTNGTASDSARIAAARFFFDNSVRMGEIEKLKADMEELQELYRSQREQEEIEARSKEKEEE